MNTKPLIAAAALNQTPMDWDGNYGRIAKAIQIAQDYKADFIVLPELCISGYGCEDWFLSSFVQETSWQILCKLIPQCHSICAVISLPYFDEVTNNLYNSSAIVADGKLIHIQLKKFLANGSVYYEPRWFSARDNDESELRKRDSLQFTIGNKVVDYKSWKLGVEICEDAWQVLESRPAYNHKTNGADVLLIPNGSHFEFGKWTTRNKIVQEAASLGLHTAYVNILGNESGSLLFDGDCIFAEANSSEVVNHSRFSFQEIVVHFSNEKTSTAIDVNQFDEFLIASTIGLFDYARKAKVRGFVLSLSGGADSACCAVLIAEMLKRAIAELGAEAVARAFSLEKEYAFAQPENPYLFLIKHILICAYQATENSSQITSHAAQVLAEQLGCRYFHWNIDNVLQFYTQTIENVSERTLLWDTDDLTLQNIQARSRSPIIWMLANMNNCLLITTSNRSEGAVGYATMDGDMSGSLAPIAGVSKHFIKQFLVHACDNLGYSSLSEIVVQKPTAELRPLSANQYDEKDLMPYSILEEIEHFMVFEKLSPESTFEKLVSLHPETEVAILKKYVAKYYQLWARNQWKRERMAPSFHLDIFSLNPRAWCRFPILNGGFQQELNALLSDVNQ